VEAALVFDQPKLSAVLKGSKILVRGNFLLLENGAVAHPAGPITEFEIKMEVDTRYPNREPRVFEVAGRIPWSADRHVNVSGSCCITVWENWLASAKDRSFSAYINGPLREYFFGQYWFEQKGEWPFGERAHGGKGLEEAYAEALGIPNRKRDLHYHLRLLSKEWPKGHWRCPCGNGKRLRNCHRQKLWALHERIPPQIAKAMLRRFGAYNKTKVGWR
jgi:hypothetical protein